jgi:1-acyl-sn-glycerol-3-phosphate acyltransferase
MSKVEHLDNPLTSLMMKTLGGIPVDRSGNIIDSTQRSINFIKEGNSFLLHPEGTRTRDGRLGAFKDGAAKIALDTGITIIPVAIDGGYQIWSYDMLLPKTRDKATGRKRRLTVTFCPEVQTLGRSEEDITAEIREKIRSRLSSEA